MNKIILLISILLGITVTTYAQKLEEKFDEMLNTQYLADEPGAVALIAVKDKIIYRKAFGMANLELDVKMKPEMVFELGSITKQFTAVSILMLLEQRKINLDDDITKYIADYPTQGYHISIHHLLTHTSGIATSTKLHPWGADERKKDFEPLDLINYFKYEPMLSAPGEIFRYNNFGYHILGYVIEKVSGKSYAEFVKTNIFQPLGMDDSRYASHSDIIKNRASGYEKSNQFVNAEYISLTQPYAAGALMSTVDDLFTWHQAILSYKLLKRETLDLAFKNYQLNDGKKINYGYGWFIDEIQGSLTQEHGGGIPGYTSFILYLPQEDVFVTVLSNGGTPKNVAVKMAALAINKSYPETPSVEVDLEILQKQVGTYIYEDGGKRMVELIENDLFWYREGGIKFKMIPVTDHSFFLEGTFTFIDFGEKDEINEVIIRNRINKRLATKVINE